MKFESLASPNNRKKEGEKRRRRKAIQTSQFVMNSDLKVWISSKASIKSNLFKIELKNKIFRTSWAKSSFRFTYSFSSNKQGLFEELNMVNGTI